MFVYSNGQPITTGGKWFTVHVIRPDADVETKVNKALRCTVIDMHDGTYDCKYNLPVVGRHLLNVTLNNVSILV